MFRHLLSRFNLGGKASSISNEKLYADLLAQYANACFAAVDSSMGPQASLLDNQRVLLSKPSLVFFRHFSLTLGKFFDVADIDATSPTLTLWIIKTYQASNDALSEIEPAYQNAILDWQARKVNSMTIALWAGNTIAAQIYQDREITVGVVAAYVEGICMLKLKDSINLIDFPKMLKQQLVERYHALEAKSYL